MRNGFLLSFLLTLYIGDLSASVLTEDVKEKVALSCAWLNKNRGAPVSYGALLEAVREDKIPLLLESYRQELEVAAFQGDPLADYYVVYGRWKKAEGESKKTALNELSQRATVFKAIINLDEWMKKTPETLSSQPAHPIFARICFQVGESFLFSDAQPAIHPHNISFAYNYFLVGGYLGSLPCRLRIILCQYYNQSQEKQRLLAYQKWWEESKWKPAFDTLYAESPLGEKKALLSLYEQKMGDPYKID